MLMLYITYYIAAPTRIYKITNIGKVVNLILKKNTLKLAILVTRGHDRLSDVPDRLGNILGIACSHNTDFFRRYSHNCPSFQYVSNQTHVISVEMLHTHE